MRTRIKDRALASIVESSGDAIIGKSLDGIIQSWNDAAERVFGYTAAEAVGRHISLIIPPDRLAEEDQHHRHPQGRAADRSLRDRARPQGRPAHPGVAHRLADKRRRRATSWARPRSSATSPASGGPRSASGGCWPTRPPPTPSSRRSSSRARCSRSSWSWTAPSSRPTGCPGKAAATGGSRSSASGSGKVPGGRPRPRWCGRSRRRPRRRSPARRSAARRLTSWPTAASGSRTSRSCRSRTRRERCCSWPRRASTSPTASAPRPIGRSS